MSKCMFCGQEKEIGLIGATGFICNDCISICHECVNEVANMTDDGSKTKLLKPHEIKEYLDKFIIGQDETKKRLAVESYNHYKTITSKKNLTLDKSNILMIGPSGCGKTALIEHLADLFKVPFAIGDATTYTARGYVGGDVDSLLVSLITKANNDIKLAEQGIIYIDEIDKIATKSGEDRKDIGGESVQYSLLKIIEGGEFFIEKLGVKINTKNILVICGGAFDGIEKIIEGRIKKVSKIGFSVEEKITEIKKEEDKNNKLKLVTADDLVKYGIIRELIGRLHLITVLDELSEADLLKILKTPKNSIVKQYKELFKIDNVKLIFDEEALKYVANQAIKKKTGARGLRSILSDKMNNLMYDIPKQEIKEFTVTKEYLSNK